MLLNAYLWLVRHVFWLTLCSVNKRVLSCQIDLSITYSSKPPATPALAAVVAMRLLAAEAATAAAAATNIMAASPSQVLGKTLPELPAATAAAVHSTPRHSNNADVTTAGCWQHTPPCHPDISHPDISHPDITAKGAALLSSLSDLLVQLNNILGIPSASSSHNKPRDAASVTDRPGGPPGPKPAVTAGSTALVSPTDAQSKNWPRSLGSDGVAAAAHLITRSECLLLVGRNKD